MRALYERRALSWKNGLNLGGSADGRDGRDFAEFLIPRLSFLSQHHVTLSTDCHREPRPITRLKHSQVRASHRIRNPFVFDQIQNDRRPEHVSGNFVEQKKI